VSNYDVFARFYDLDTAEVVDDLPFWLALARRTGGPVLEIGCGTGRVLIPLAEAGLDVVGVDISPAMLAIARDKVFGAGVAAKVELIQADALRLQLGRTFPCAFIALNSFGHFVEPGEPEIALARLRHHLEPGGMLALDLPNPMPGAFGDTSGVLIHDYTRPGPSSERHTVKLRSQAIDPIEQVIEVSCLYDEVGAAGEVRRTLASFDLRYFYRNELRLLLERAGLVLEATYGSYDLEPLDEASERFIAIARVPEKPDAIGQTIQGPASRPSRLARRSQR
jgi:SAM-dependent methyltransferase